MLRVANSCASRVIKLILTSNTLPDKMAWRDRRLLERLGLRSPLIQAPMAGAQASDLAISVAKAGALGSIPCAMLSPDAMRSHVQRFRDATRDSSSPLNLNFFCHTTALPSTADRDAQWRDTLAPYYREYGVDLAKMDAAGGAQRKPFDETSLALVQELRPEVVSFHFGLPTRPEWLEAIKATGALVLSSATTVNEARWLEARGCDVIIAQGFEAGGHRGVFLPQQGAAAASPNTSSYALFAQQLGTMALVPQIVDAVSVPVIAAGGIGDARGILAASVLGAAGVQMGTVFLLADEAQTSQLHRSALKQAGGNGADEAMETAITNVFTGRPARGFTTRLVRELGPISPHALEFPTAGAALAPLKKVAEARGDVAFSSLWSGQSPGFAQEKSGEAIIQSLNEDLDELLRKIRAGYY